jgi:uncharacterized membrane protein (UPF0127 family)
MFWPFSRLRGHAAGLTLAVLLFAAGCGRDAAEPVPRAKTVNDWFAVAVGGQTVQMQLAIFPVEMERGLMQRRDLGKGQGMLFIYGGPTQMSFWMRNTPLPLDIGFFSSDGELREVYTMLPYDETPIRSRSNALKFALEMNQGWFRENRVGFGARLDIAAVREALKARGVASEAFGLP